MAAGTLINMADIIGLVGVCCFLYAYLLLQSMKTGATSAKYLMLNLVGAILVMISLIFDWNLPAFLLEAAWASISMYGIYKHIYLPKRNAK
jgi:hypothetical protein